LQNSYLLLTYVKELAEKIISDNAEFIEAGNEAKSLADHYLKEKIVTAKFRSDAMHIALATIHKIDAVSAGTLNILSI